MIPISIHMNDTYKDIYLYIAGVNTKVMNFFSDSFAIIDSESNSF